MKTLIRSLLLIGLVSFGSSARAKTSELLDICKTFGTSFAIHYCGQTITNAIYTALPKLKKQGISWPLSFCQTLGSAHVTNSLISNKANGFSPSNNGITNAIHLFGWLCATYTDKPATLIQDEYFNTEDDSEEIS